MKCDIILYSKTAAVDAYAPKAQTSITSIYATTPKVLTKNASGA